MTISKETYAHVKSDLEQVIREAKNLQLGTLAEFRGQLLNPVAGYPQRPELPRASTSLPLYLSTSLPFLKTRATWRHRRLIFHC